MSFTFKENMLNSGLSMFLLSFRPRLLLNCVFSGKLS